MRLALGLAAVGVVGLASASTAPTFVSTAGENMNGEYTITPTVKGGSPDLFPTNFKDYGHGVEYFDVYSGEISTLYSQVWWKPLEPVALPDDIVQRYAGKGMAIVGFEVDQIRRTPDGDVSVPISATYNHHYVTVMVGANARFVPTKFEGPDDPRIATMYGGMDAKHSHGVPWEQTNYVVQPVGEVKAGDLPSSQLFDGANGGEYRMSFHGVAPGQAIIVDSPTELQITPMQIDTWNRKAMNISSGEWVPFVPGPLPRGSESPANADYSGLLECPITTRITKKVDGGYVAQGTGQCESPIESAAECYAAAAATLNGGGSGSMFTNSSGTDATKPSGCSATTSVVFFNELQNSTVNCAAKAPVLAGTIVSFATVELSLDVATSLATITLSGPSDVWYGVGFNAGKMADTPWTVVVDGAGEVTERQLADHAFGTELKSSVSVVSSTVAGAVRTVVLTRPFKGAGDAYFTFNSTAADATILVITAVGPSADVSSFHGDNKGPAAITLLPVEGQGSPGACVCPEAPKPFGKAKGVITYNPTAQPEDIGTGSAGFSKNCLAQPATDMLWQENPTCDIRTYVGGMWVCKHAWSLLDADQEIPWADQPLVFEHKYRFWVQPYNESYHTGLTRRHNWGLGSSIEFDVPKCAEGIKGCSLGADGSWVHTVRGAFVADGTLSAIHFHCHAPACINMALYQCPNGTALANCNEKTGEPVCSQTPVFGTGEAAKYQEPGYLLVPPCLWGKAEHGLEPPLVLEGPTWFLIKTSNATYGHLGEMAAAQVYTYPTV